MQPRSYNLPDGEGHVGEYGGQYVLETLLPALHELDRASAEARADPVFQEELDTLLRHYAGRPTPLYHAQRLSSELGIQLYLKREDLAHTGAHKINNSLGRVLLARRMGKTRLIA